MERPEQFAPDHANVRAVRRLLVQVLSSTDDAEAAVLLASELSQNAVDHARTPFTVMVRHDDRGALTVEVHDDSSDLPVLEPHDPLASRGRGLQIVDALSLDWGVTSVPDDGKTVWFRLPPAAV